MPIRTDSTARQDDEHREPRHAFHSEPSGGPRRWSTCHSRSLRRVRSAWLVRAPWPVPAACALAVRAAASGRCSATLPGRPPTGPIRRWHGWPSRPAASPPISALLAAIGGSAVPSTTAAGSTTAVPAPVQTVVRYVYLPAGQASPAAGLATVITPPAPAQAPAPVVTRQSGAKP